MQNPYDPYSPRRSVAPSMQRRRGRRGCVRGCLGLGTVIGVVLVLLTIVLRFVPIPFLVFLNPLPYYFQYSHLVHPGQTQVYRVAWSPVGTDVASVSAARTVQVWWRQPVRPGSPIRPRKLQPRSRWSGRPMGNSLRSPTPRTRSWSSVPQAARPCSLCPLPPVPAMPLPGRPTVAPSRPSIKMGISRSGRWRRTRRC